MTATMTSAQRARKVIEDNIFQHTQSLCEALQRDFEKDSSSGYEFVIETGKKYYKVIMETGDGSRSVHCFVDKKTGEVYKAARWRGPAKPVRFDLRLIKDREYLFENADWAGGYLYM